jgi:membrane-associated protein
MVNFFVWAFDVFLHLDKYLASIISQYGVITYFLLFLVVFMETGFVVTPFLPGDSLLFAAGALSATSSLSVWVVYFLLLAAAVGGDTVNYWIGHYLGPVAFEKYPKVFKRKYLDKTHAFYAKYGNKTIVLARFVPIVRTFAPFVAGVAKMTYPHFIMYNIVGGFLWVSFFVWGGFFFGNLPFVQKNFHYVVLGIILLSITPIIFEVVSSGKSRK